MSEASLTPKGDQRRSALLAVCEGLFLSRGYDRVSVSDILAAANVSKGAFYHYFPSKEDALREVCALRAEKDAAAFRAQRPEDALERLDLILYYCYPLRKGEERFLRAVAPLCGRAEGITAMRTLRDARRARFLPEMIEVLNTLSVEKRARIEQALLPELLYDACDALAEESIAAIRRNQGDPAALQKEIKDALDAMRFLWERALSLPFGSVTIARAEEALPCAALVLRDL